mgnify:FL=1
MHKRTSIKRAMVLAAGLGERMRPLTDNTPKPLLKLQGHSLIDYALDRLQDAGIETVVVNTFYLADQMDEHLSKRSHPEILISREEERLETGGGVLNALPLLGDEPFFVINGDAFWLNGPTDALGRMHTLWDERHMDALLMMHATVDAYGFTGRGDFLLEPDGELSRRPEGEVCPYMFAGIQILHPRLFKSMPEGVFSLNRMYDLAIENGTLYGMIHDGEWFHIGTQEGLEETDAFMKVRYSGVKRR